MRRAACVAGVFVVACLGGCGNSAGQGAHVSPSAAISSPTPDAATQSYVALIRGYWAGILDADQIVNGSNLAAKVCLGGPANDLNLVDPAGCRQRAVAILAVQEKFLSDLGASAAPARFAADDGIFRTQIPNAIASVNALISACDTGSQKAVLDAGNAYVNVMRPAVTNALDDVDPAVVHN
jgi:hypothetical protein